MSEKKKVSKGAVALGATLLVGGTLAWFTSSDELRNIFSTETDLNSGIQIEENFPGSVPDKDGNPVYNKPVIPGTDITKEAWVQSKANYDQFIRAKVVKEFKDKDGNLVNYYRLTENKLYEYAYAKTGTPEGDGWKKLDTTYIVETYPDATAFANNWLKGTKFDTSGWYYYDKIVTADDKKDGGTDQTTNLIKSVKLDPKADNAYLNLRFDVQVLSESIQATGGAIKDTESGWGADAPKAVQDLDKTEVTPAP